MAELYLFDDNGTKYAYVAGFSAITDNSIEYKPTLIKRNAIKYSDNFAKTPLSFFVSKSNYLGQKILNTIPERPITVKIIDSDTSNLLWSGRVLKVKATLVSIEIICDSVYAASLRAGNRYIVSPQCQHVLYSSACAASMDLHRVNILDANVTNSTILTVYGLTVPSGYFTNGVASFNGELRRILKHQNEFLYISTVFNSIGVGTLSLLKGCNLTSKDCQTFNNLDNQLAFEFAPNKSPFKVGLLI